MAKVDYDHFAGLYRLAQAAATVDQRAAVILTYHAALEREIDVVLGGLLPHAERVRRIGFKNKMDVLAAAWRGDDAAGEKLYEVLFRFNDLRNAVAHGDRAELVEGCLERLLTAYRDIVHDADEHIEIDELAAGICGFMADEPTTPNQMTNVFQALDKLVNVTAPAALGVGGETPRGDAR